MVGVAVGVAAFTVVLSVMSGFVSNMKKRLLGVEPHIEIVRTGSFGNIPAQNGLLEKISGNQSLQKKYGIEALSPFVKGDAIIQSNGRATTIVLHGVDSQTKKAATSFSQFLHSYSELSFLNKFSTSAEGDFPTVAIGAELMNALALSVGDRVTLVSTTPEEGPFGLAPKQFPVVIGDGLTTGAPTYDAKAVVASLEVAEDFFGIENEWSGIQLKLSEPLNADNVAEGLNEFISKNSKLLETNEGEKPTPLRAKPWTESNKALLRALKLERWGMSFVLAMVILVACFSITITLVLTVRRKQREMAILRALGMRKKELGALYLFEGLAIGAIGVGAGVGVGLVLLAALQSDKFPLLARVYAGKGIPVIVDWNAIATVVTGSLILSVVAALWPAVEVMKIDVVDTLRDIT
jgi:lipoprotein-releasing system permease protein